MIGGGQLEESVLTFGGVWFKELECTNVSVEVWEVVGKVELA